MWHRGPSCSRIDDGASWKTHNKSDAFRLLLGLFVFCLIASGLTAFPLVWETRLLAAWFGEGSRIASVFPGLGWWLTHVHEDLEASYGTYPFLAYGTDWLAFAHIVIGIAFWVC